MFPVTDSSNDCVDVLKYLKLKTILGNPSMPRTWNWIVPHLLLNHFHTMDDIYMTYKVHIYILTVI